MFESKRWGFEFLTMWGLFLDMVGGVGAGLERDCDILFVPNQSKGLFAVAGHTRRVESGDGGIQREADGVGMQIVGSVV